LRYAIAFTHNDELIQELKANTDKKITSFEIRLRQLEDELNDEQAKRINAESEVRGTKMIFQNFFDHM
jgi:hypothetical protein